MASDGKGIKSSKCLGWELWLPHFYRERFSFPALQRRKTRQGTETNPRISNSEWWWCKWRLAWPRVTSFVRGLLTQWDQIQSWEQQQVCPLIIKESLHKPWELHIVSTFCSWWNSSQRRNDPQAQIQTQGLLLEANPFHLLPSQLPVLGSLLPLCTNWYTAETKSLLSHPLDLSVTLEVAGDPLLEFLL